MLTISCPVHMKFNLCPHGLAWCNSPPSVSLSPSPSSLMGPVESIASFEHVRKGLAIAHRDLAIACRGLGVSHQQLHGVGRCVSTLPSQRTIRVRASRAQLWGVKRQRQGPVAVRMSVNVDDSATEDSTSADDIIKQATDELSRELDPRRGLEERYLVINSGKHECRSCGYIYETEKGDSSYPIAGGIPFSQLPDDWRCPTCGAAQTYFQSKGVEVAGFAQNQSYGLGGNSLTEGQKSLLIYGSLIFFFVLFLAGYLLQ